MTDNYSKIIIENAVDHRAWEMRKMHDHNAHELFFLYEGKRRYFIEDTLFDIEIGNMVLVEKNKLHRTIINGNEPYSRYLVYFEEDAIRPFIERIGANRFEKLMQSNCLELTPNVSQQILQHLEAMYAEQSSPDEHSYIMIVNLLENILLLAMRHGISKPPNSEKGISKMQDVAHYINNNFASPLSLRDVAAIAHMEATYFSKCFKAATGVGFQEYLSKLRLKKAEQLLEHTSLSVGKIAEACGYSSTNYFSDVFRHRNGCSPSQYRRQTQEETDDL